MEKVRVVGKLRNISAFVEEFFNISKMQLTKHGAIWRLAKREKKC